MSASRDERQAYEYMQEEGGQNVLWEITAMPENDTGYHCGADVEMLSQFAHEKEVLCVAAPQTPDLAPLEPSS